MNPIARRSMSTLVIQPSFRALGQMQVKWQTFENPENKRQMYGRQAWVDPLPTIWLAPSTLLLLCFLTEKIEIFSIRLSVAKEDRTIIMHSC